MPEQASAFMREPFRTSLVRAVLWQTEEGSGVIPSLVQHGWDVNRPSVTVVDGGEAVVMHPLVIACLEGCGKAVQVLIDSQADLSVVSVVPCGPEGGNMAPFPGAQTLHLTPLMTAVHLKNYAIAQLLLDAGVNPNQGTVTGTPLTFAAWRRDPTTTAQLIAAGVCVDDRVKDGIAPLHMVTESGDVEIVKQLLAANAAVDATTAASDRNGRGRSPLWIAAKAGNLELVRLLLDARANCNLQSGERGTTPLLEGCMCGAIEMVNLFIARNSDVNMAGADGLSPLIAACEINSIPLIKVLLAAGAKVDQRSASGATALYTCASLNHLEAARLIQAAGADLTLGTLNDGASPLFVACAKGNAAIVDWLVGISADVNQMTTTKAGVSPLYVASHLGRAEIVERLLRNPGCNVNLASLDNARTPLYTACAEGHTSVVRSLLQGHAAVNQTNTSRKTPLHKACETGRLDIVRLLIDGSAEVNAVSDDYRTPLSEAVSYSHRRCASVLVRFGASLTQPAQSGMMLQPLGLAVAQGKLSIAQDLAAFGAPITPDVVARPLDPQISAWLGKVIQWNAPQRALQTCRPDILQYLLQCTDANLAQVPRGTPTAFELIREIQTELSSMDADLRAAAKETVALAVAALKGWRRSSHWLFPNHFKRTVVTVLLVARRLRATAGGLVLPTELWELVLNFVCRGRIHRPRRPSAFAHPAQQEF